MNCFKSLLLNYFQDLRDNIGLLSGRQLCLIVGGFLFLLINSIYWYTFSHRLLSVYFSALLFVLFTFFVSAAISNNFDQVKEARLFLASLTILGILFSGVFTPLSAPDEDFHFTASYTLSNFIMGKGYQSEDPLLMRQSDAEFYNEFVHNLDLSSDNYSYLNKEYSQLFVSSNSEIQTITGRSHSVSNSLPQEKLLSALGITVARLLNLGPAYPYLFGRLFNLAFYITCVYIAFRITPIGRNIIAVISLFPMCLHLAASYSYDSFIIPMSILLTALCLRSIKAEGLFSLKEGSQILFVAMLLAPCKVIYTLVALLALFIPQRRFRSRKEELLIKLGCMMLVGMVLAGGRLLVYCANSTSATSAVNNHLDFRGDQSGHFYTVSDVVQNPLKFVKMLYLSLDHFGFEYLQRMVGGSLGWFQEEIVSPYIYVVALTMVMGMSVISSDDDGDVLSFSASLAGIAVFVIGLVLVMLTLLVSWVFNTEGLITGVQGRYFLPYLPWLLISFRTSRLKFDGNLFPYLLMAMLFLNFYNLTRIFSIALTL